MEEFNEELKKIQELGDADCIIKEINKMSDDDVEYIYLLSTENYGWHTLSSGKTVYISFPPCSAEKVGNALKTVLGRLQQDSNK